MRKTPLFVMFAATGTLACAGLTTAAATPTHVGAPTLGQAHSAAQTHRIAPPHACFSNLAGDTGYPSVSQNFEATFDTFDAVAADDFSITQDCKVSSVDIPGQYFNGPGPATSENVTFYEDASGQPGAVISAQTVVGSETAPGTFHIPLRPFILEDDDPYWLSVQVNMDFTPNGQWGWENSNVQAGLPALWQDPGDGFGFGCTAWKNLQTCLGAPGPDQLFSVNGTAFRYKFSRIVKPTQHNYTTKSCAEDPSNLADGAIISVYTNGACPLPHGKGKFKVMFSTPVEKLSVPNTWPNWGSPNSTESATPDVFFTQAATSLTIDYNGLVQTGGFEAQPAGTAVHVFTSDFYSGPSGTGILLGSVTQSISGNAGAKLLGAHCKYIGWGSIVVSTDIPFAIAVIRV